MTVNPSIDSARLLEEQLARASPDLLRELLGTFINTLLSAEADAVCGAEYVAVTPERVNRRNGYRHRDFDTRAGTLDVAIPKLRQGSYFPEWLLERKEARRTGADQRGGDLLPVGCLDAADGQACAVPRHHQPVEVPGLRDGRGARRPRRGVPHPLLG
jgi:hypothetical protein